MRNWILALVLLSLGALVVVQCGGWGYWELDGDNGGGCPVCDGVICEDDGNECTDDICNCETGECGFTEGLDGFVCDLDGSTGVCLDGTCQEDVWCNGICDDGNECTRGRCLFDEGTCDEETDPIGDGTICSSGVCRDGVCGTLVDQCTTDDLSAIDAGDEPRADALTTCRGEWGGLPEPKEGCITFIKDCLQESGTSLSPECSECFALGDCCMIYECGCESPEPRCEECIEESCQPLMDACVGRQ